MTVISDKDEKQESLSIDSAQQLTFPINTKTQIPSLTPRWLIRFLPWINVETGIYRINHVKSAENESQKLPITKKATIGNKEDYYFLSDLLKCIPLFSCIPDELLKEILEGMHEKNTIPGQVIVKQNDKGDEFYVVTDGLFEVSVEGRHGKKLVLKLLAAGDYFGEMALLGKTVRQATITATTKGSLITLNKETFDKILNNSTLKDQLESVFNQRKKELALSGESDIGTSLLSAHTGTPLIPNGFIEYDTHPREMHLSIIQTILSIPSRVSDLYNSNSLRQFDEQLRVTIETILEKEEWEILNNKDFGLIANISPDMVIETKSGPPTPDDLDELLSLIWKKPSFFLAHPKAINAFCRECTYSGIYPPSKEIFGHNFITWRNIPIIPSDKIIISNENGVPTTSILLMRVGEEEQGIVGLHKENVNSSIKVDIASLSVEPLGVNGHSIKNYLITKYFSVAPLTQDSIAILKNIELGNYRE